MNKFNLKEGDKVKIHMYELNYSPKKEINLGEINDVVFDVYKKNGKLGIDYDKYARGWFLHEDGFRPLDEFATTTVEFEKVA